ncbi:hypothetical protein FB45DRAFT_779197 [Roridomyces roridus]|uniref:MFS general substrate transporter n=1 Tax=Roridomyces roridus TaxID=1738132 RepID=A0AAD7CIW7_9AGAR|nr:hypothetical protein FB45DRAFT_779197 [Roridomyces roridus]
MPPTSASEQVSDPLVAVFASPSRLRSPSTTHSLLPDALGEHEPLLPRSTTRPPKKPFYRARPLWLVPFAVLAALVRGMTIAPRVEVFTQLSCSRLHHSYNHTAVTPWSAEPNPISSHALVGLDPLGPPLTFPVLDPPVDEPWGDEDTGGDDPRRLPSARCMHDPAVQAGAARIQTIFTITMGLLSALTTGWWGRFGERHGRTRILAISTLGLLLVDLIFILTSTPSSPLSGHGHKLLLLAPILEGALGGYSTLQSATSAYISDCTSSGSRALMFSRFTGVSFVGLGIAPLIGSLLIRHPIPFFDSPPHPGQPKAQSVTSVFWVAVCFSFLNLCFALFVIPESTTVESRDLARGNGKGKAPDRNGATEEGTNGEKAKLGVVAQFLSPLAIFLPVTVTIDGSTRKRKDWSLTLLAASLLGVMLSTGLYQIKYLYAGHVYGWGAEQLSYYISLLGSTRAVYLLFVLPFIISAFKPKAKKVKAVNGVKPAPTRAHIAREIKFDLGLSRLSLVIDIIGNLFIVFAPGPAYEIHSLTASSPDFRTSQALFVLASWIQALGAGVIPAMQSLALCILQARSILAAEAGQDVVDTGAGSLFGALSVLQAGGQMVLGPLLFGMVYSETVAFLPKTIFLVAITILFGSLITLMLIRSPLSESKSEAVRRRRRQASRLEEETRGRSRVSKDLWGYGAVQQQERGLPPNEGPSSASV